MNGESGVGKVHPAQTVSQAAMGRQGIQMSSDQISVRDRVRSRRNLIPDPLLPHQPAFK